MTKKKLIRLRTEFEELKRRRRNLSERDLTSFAGKIGRRLFSRGGHPTYVSDLLPNRNPISIPRHRGNVPVGTAGNILDQFEADLDLLEESLTEEATDEKEE